MEHTAIRETIGSYICQLANEDNLDHSMNLFERNVLTSLDVLDIIGFIETTFSIDFSDDDIDAESFGSINSIVCLIERLKQK